ncbi:hypothetical protein CEXT_256451 [Caerostris extrusa]|uniref:C2H2-type domain-containing protein n=1 Tax=Caerostris extrusa TaxID=172846 RepID=A0AAV4QPF4_CAEEX|nr:hypothetical protein CEXT_256451 [Caerostris extrusa]
MNFKSMWLFTPKRRHTNAVCVKKHLDIIKSQEAFENTLQTEASFVQQGVFAKHNLQNHYLVHTEEELYECETCQRGFSVKSNLTAHLLTHSEERPFCVMYAEKNFLKSRFIAS